MPRQRKDPPSSYPGHPTVVPPVRVDPAGVTGPTPKQARGPRWRRTSSGLFVPAAVDADDPLQRIAEAASDIPGYGGVTGWAALKWMGSRWHDGVAPDGQTLRPVVIAICEGNVRPTARRLPSKERLAPTDLITVDGLPVTTAVRSVCFEMRYAATVRRAVVHLDMAAFNDLVSIDECARYVAGLNGWTGVPQCREALDLADENSWSPQETLMRLTWTHDAGRPRPLCNRPVFDLRGNHVGTPDLIDPEAGIVGEYDGFLHLAGKQRARDVERESAFRSLGLEYVTMLAADHRTDAFVARLQSAYARARFLPPGRRQWTIEPPPWWIPTTTVAERRALDERLREALLGRRAA